MGDDRADLLLHPLRLRILQAAAGRDVTTADLAAALPEVATATLYRHVRRLLDGGALQVVAERPVRGTVERTYRLAAAASPLTADEIADLSPDDHRAAFTTFAAGLLRAVTDYLDDPAADPAHDGFGYRHLALWADDAEFEAFAADLRAVVLRAVERGPGPGRRRRTLTTVVVPDPGPTTPARPDRHGAGPGNRTTHVDAAQRAGTRGL
ncbi:helix-turn-helix domain-containing protein [Egicoccus halophilus]|uniref:Transcriptional regulator n=1 Tax=Egicoccus halophilus TaxID=1670830 RepID=A0A8J3AF32_9ACTN|nr:helix-turn-helix domain-containing protein [Egicoccus halophilus]GGI06308.1 transcriptional regulator [Egicoccus halophilus]